MGYINYAYEDIEYIKTSDEYLRIDTKLPLLR